MAASSRKSSSAPAPTPNSDEAVMSSDAAQNIWLAGLGAFVKAQAEGSKAFEALVADGVAMQRKTQALAQQRMVEATQQIEEMAARATGAGNWSRLGGIFENRVERALSELGMPTAAELAQLDARLRAVEDALAQLAGGAAAADQGVGKRPTAAPTVPAQRRSPRPGAAANLKGASRTKKNAPRA